jgi:hypothetical protein
MSELVRSPALSPNGSTTSPRQSVDPRHSRHSHPPAGKTMRGRAGKGVHPPNVTSVINPTPRTSNDADALTYPSSTKDMESSNPFGDELAKSGSEQVHSTASHHRHSPGRAN